MEAVISPLPDDVEALKALLVSALQKADEAEAKLANAHGSKPSSLSDEEWVMVLSHRNRQAAAKPARKSAAKQRTATVKTAAKTASSRKSAAKTTTARTKSTWTIRLMLK